MSEFMFKVHVFNIIYLTYCMYNLIMLVKENNEKKLLFN